MNETVGWLHWLFCHSLRVNALPALVHPSAAPNTTEVVSTNADNSCVQMKRRKPGANGDRDQFDLGVVRG